jgi:Cu(I)/Ag(I) efflux system membrane protein CusA/SilA
MAAVKRLRPKSLTLTIAWWGQHLRLGATGTGAELTSQLAAPLVGGIHGGFLMARLVYPVIFYWAKRRGLNPAASAVAGPQSPRATPR